MRLFSPRKNIQPSLTEWNPPIEINGVILNLSSERREIT